MNKKYSTIFLSPLQKSELMRNCTRILKLNSTLYHNLTSIYCWCKQKPISLEFVLPLNLLLRQPLSVFALKGAMFTSAWFECRMQTYKGMQKIDTLTYRRLLRSGGKERETNYSFIIIESSFAYYTNRHCSALCTTERTLHTILIQLLCLLLFPPLTQYQISLA